MKSLEIVLTSLRSLREHPEVALRCFLGPVILVTVVPDLLLPAVMQPRFRSFLRGGMSEDFLLLGLGLGVPLFLLKVMLYAQAAVAWHRFVLTGEQPARFFPRPTPRQTLAYLAVGSVQGVMAGVVIAIIGSIGMLAVGQFTQASTPLAFVLLGVVYVTGAWIFLLLALILPGFAIDKGDEITKGLDATAQSHGLFAALAVLMLAFGLLVGLLAALIAWLAPFLALGSAFPEFALLAVNASLLTTLYRRFIRQAPDA